MGELISTILLFLGGFSGSAPANARFPGIAPTVGTTTRDSYSPGIQVVTRAMHHSLYSGPGHASYVILCNSLGARELGRGPHPPDRRIQGVGWGGIPLYLLQNFFKPLFDRQYPENFYQLNF